MCDFPSRQLIEYEHRVVGEADAYTQAQLVYVHGLVKAIEELADYHEYLTECRCWYEALVELGYLDEAETAK